MTDKTYYCKGMKGNRMEPSRITNGIQEHRLTSWREYVDFIEKHHANHPAFVYRGQADSAWKVASTLDRLEQHHPQTRNFHGAGGRPFDVPPAGRDVHLKAFKEAVRGRRGVNPPELDEDEWWALAQHHGLATPMLDFTYSPFVALFFAFEQEQCKDPDGRLIEPEARAVIAVSTSTISKKQDMHGPPPQAYSPKGETSLRAVNQGALFLKMPQGKDLETYMREAFADESQDKNHRARAIVEKIIIPNEDRTDCLKLLNKMNIHRSSLFPDLDGAAEYINALWELDFDTSLGNIPDHLIAHS